MPSGYFIDPNESDAENAWFYRQGKGGEIMGGREIVDAQVSDEPLDLPTLPPLEVL